MANLNLLALTGYIPRLLAGEALLQNDAVCIDYDLTSTSYKIYKTNATNGNRTASFVGFAVKAYNSGDVVDVMAGLVSGFSGLTPGINYFLSDTAGQIATSAGTQSLLVGVAFSSTQIFAIAFKNGFNLPVADQLIRFLGQTTSGTVGTGTNSVEHFNYSSWSTSANTVPFAGSNGALGEHNFSAGNLLLADYVNTSGSATLATRTYNKVSWSSALSNRTNVKFQGGVGILSGVYYNGKGYDNVSNRNDIDSFNGTSWTNGITSVGSARRHQASMVQGGLLHFVGGFDSGDSNAHDTFNGTSAGSQTVYPRTTTTCVGFRFGTNGMIGGIRTPNFTDSYTWNGSSWSTSYTMSYGPNNASASGGSACLAGNGNGYANGGAGTAGDGNPAVSTTAKFNGTSWAADTSSNLARAITNAAAI